MAQEDSGIDRSETVDAAEAKEGGLTWKPALWLSGPEIDAAVEAWEPSEGACAPYPLPQWEELNAMWTGPMGMAEPFPKDVAYRFWLLSGGDLDEQVRSLESLHLWVRMGVDMLMGKSEGLRDGEGCPKVAPRRPRGRIPKN